SWACWASIIRAAAARGCFLFTQQRSSGGRPCVWRTGHKTVSISGVRPAHTTKYGCRTGELITALTDPAVETEDAFPSEQVGGYFPVSETTPTKQEDDHPGLDLQETLDLESPSKTKLSVFRLRPLVWSFSTVLVAGLIHW